MNDGIRKFAESLRNLMNLYDSDATIELTVGIGGVKRGCTWTATIDDVRRYPVDITERQVTELMRGLSKYGPGHFRDWVTDEEKTDDEFLAEEKAFAEKMRGC